MRQTTQLTEQQSGTRVSKGKKFSSHPFPRRRTEHSDPNNRFRRCRKLVNRHSRRLLLHCTVTAKLYFPITPIMVARHRNPQPKQAGRKPVEHWPSTEFQFKKTNTHTQKISWLHMNTSYCITSTHLKPSGQRHMCLWSLPVQEYILFIAQARTYHACKRARAPWHACFQMCASFTHVQSCKPWWAKHSFSWTRIQ